MKEEEEEEEVDGENGERSLGNRDDSERKVKEEARSFNEAFANSNDHGDADGAERAAAASKRAAGW